jgi:hypothetical protein
MKNYIAEYLINSQRSKLALITANNIVQAAQLADKNRSQYSDGITIELIALRLVEY